MSKKLIPLFIAFTSLFASCTSDETTGGNDTQSIGLDCKAAPVEYEEGSRSTLSLGESGMVFSWEQNDQLSVFYSESDQTAAIYTLNFFYDEHQTSANFKSEGFMLTADKRYYAISTTEAKAPKGVSIPDKRNIVLTYAGQIQKGNKSTAHLGAYDYMAASGVAEGDDHVGLDFKHLGCVVRVIMDGLPANIEFNKMEMYDTENSYLQPSRTFNMTKGLAADGTYTPALDAVDITSAEYKTSDRFSLKLEGEETGHGMKAGGTDITDGRLDMFIELPPANLIGKDLIFMVYGSNNNAYYIKCAGKDLKAGKAYQMKGTAQETTSYTVKIKVNHEWQLGSTLDSRATSGDPGLDDKFPYPTNLYYVLCVGEKVKTFQKIENIDAAKWARSADNAISTYSEQLTFEFDDTEKDKTKNLYIVASNDDLSSSFSSVTTSTTEAQIQSLVYSISGSDEQSFMKNLYSTPWTGSVSSFVGNLGSDYFKDIILYHVAAKVDLKWNSTLTLTGNVSVNNVKNTNLYIFKPTENTYDTGSYTATSTIGGDQQYNGRQVFYLPQFATCKYNVTVGSNTGDITFAPATTNGFTSWLRWLKKF